MAILSMEEGNPLLEAKTIAALKRKKEKRKNQESSGSTSAQHPSSSNSTSPNTTGDKEAVTPTDGTSPGNSRKAEATVAMASNIDPEILKLATLSTASDIHLEVQEQTKIPKDYGIDPDILKLAQAAGATLECSKEAKASSPTEPEKLAQATNATPECSGEAKASSPTEPEKLVQATNATPECSGEAKATSPPEPERQSAEISFDDSAKPAGSISSPHVQQNDALPNDSHSPTTSGQTGDHNVFQQDLKGQTADDCSLENMRPNAQNLRYGGYPAQPAPPNRNTPLGSGRLQNTSKLGNGTNWGFAAPANGAPGLPSVQPSQTGTGASSFAQRVGGSQPAAPLDLSEFPSLSGSSQPQFQNASQAVWANQRVAQQTPVQRPQQSHQVSSQAQQQHPQNQQSQDQPQRGNDDMYSASSNLQSSLDDHRYGGQTGISQMPSTRQPQPTSVDEFPPLGRNGTDEGDSDRRNMMQYPAFGGFQGLPGTSTNQANNTRSSSAVDRLTSPNGMGFGASSTVRSPTESNRQGQSGMQDHERNNASTSQGNTRNEHNMNALLTNLNVLHFSPPQQTGQPQQAQQGRQDYGARTGESSRSNDTPDRTPLSQMSELDEFGIQGFLDTVNNENPDVSYLARGQDLTTLGLNLNSSEPLWHTWGGPFAEPGSRPLQPDFRLPDCYTVENVHGVREKIPSFADETLFFIFYTQVRDIMQEWVAQELNSRNWRYHIELKMWLTKDGSLPEPVQISPEKEQGSYVFFNHMTWEKVRASNFELHYKQLAPTTPRQNVQ